jgi:DNA-binding transcriptional MerR regulator
MENNEEYGMVTGGKTYYSISEVCSLIGVEAHVLRYWESEFPQLHPKKNRAGNRAYRDKDIALIKTIRRLLYEEGFTITGAKRKLGETRSRAAEGEQIKLEPGAPHQSSAVDVRKELEGILGLLSG